MLMTIDLRSINLENLVKNDIMKAIVGGLLDGIYNSCRKGIERNCRKLTRCDIKFL